MMLNFRSLVNEKEQTIWMKSSLWLNAWNILQHDNVLLACLLCWRLISFKMWECGLSKSCHFDLYKNQCKGSYISLVFYCYQWIVVITFALYDQFWWLSANYIAYQMTKYNQKRNKNEMSNIRPDLLYTTSQMSVVIIFSFKLLYTKSSVKLDLNTHTVKNKTNHKQDDTNDLCRICLIGTKT